jgi:hypothetical protein
MPEDDRAGTRRDGHENAGTRSRAEVPAVACLPVRRPHDALPERSGAAATHRDAMLTPDATRAWRHERTLTV